MITIEPEAESVKCPHCLVTIFVKWDVQYFAGEPGARWLVRSTGCPACQGTVTWLIKQPFELSVGRGVPMSHAPEVNIMVWPRAVARAPVPKLVTKAVADEYLEAWRVLADSAKASAALSRRCLQNVLIEKAGAKKKDLADQIQEVLDSKALPGRLADDLHAVRVIGNFGAHPIKSTSTGQIVDVEPGEAEWNLDVLEALFDFYWVEPEKQKKRRDALNAKLKDAGKPPLA